MMGEGSGMLAATCAPELPPVMTIDFASPEWHWWDDRIVPSLVVHGSLGGCRGGMASGLSHGPWTTASRLIYPPSQR